MTTTSATDSPRVDIGMLWNAAKKHDATLVKELILQANAAFGSLSIVNEFHPKKGTTPLMVACKKRDKSYSKPSRNGAETVQILLEFGADMALPDQLADAHTALHYAAISNHVRAVEFMLHAGVDAFVLNKHGHAAIDLARWHRSRDVLDVLTQHSRIHSGWLYVKKLKSGNAAAVASSTASSATSLLHVWKKRWAIALSCDAARSVVELSLFKDRDDLKPQRVILLKPEAHAMVASPKKKWLDRHNMFHVDSAIMVQHARTKRRFSRNQEHHQQQRLGEIEQIQFAADSAIQRDAWLAILLRRRHLPPPPSTVRESRQSNGESFAIVPDEFMRWPSPVDGSGAVAPSSLSQHQQPHQQQYDLFGSTSTTPTDTPPRSIETPSAPSFSGSMDAYGDISTSSPAFLQQVATISSQQVGRTLATAPSEGSSMAGSSITSTSFPPSQRDECVICMDAPRDAICVPCGHVAGCHACLQRHVTLLHQCPICRAHVHTVIKIYEC